MHPTINLRKRFCYRKVSINLHKRQRSGTKRAVQHTSKISSIQILSDGRQLFCIQLTW